MLERKDGIGFAKKKHSSGATNKIAEARTMIIVSTFASCRIIALFATTTKKVKPVDIN